MKIDQVTKKKKKKKRKKESVSCKVLEVGYLGQLLICQRKFLYAFLDIISHLLFGGDFGMNPFLCVNLEL